MVSTLDSFYMMLVCKYFQSFDDFIRVMSVSKKYNNIVTKLNYNPIPLTEKTLRHFTQLETLHVYTHGDPIFIEKTFNARVYHYMKINVQTLVKTTVVYVHNLATVLDLKTEIEKSEYCPTCRQRIVFNKNLLQNDVKLQDVGIVNESTVLLALSPLEKPVILLYDSNASEETNSKQKVDIQIELNNTTFSCLYPTPQYIDEHNKKCVWSAFYASKQHNKVLKDHKEDDNLIIEVNGKKYEYLFWEGETHTTFDGQKYVANNIEGVREVLERLGLNSREQNDFIVYWVKTLVKYKKIGITVCDVQYENEAKLSISGFENGIRVFLQFFEADGLLLKSVEELEKRQRPIGKYFVEWGASLI
ncbi:hypothetical protein EIN_310870 [Entamoeba invadens IP1]|uniref:Ubiquitin-like domain-containing protein n=1 Tax=Entamoeba invadens IP1 TaxID=370355 RepID=L7FK32_ENTIV|nr:hypothetical protein EIN_310870 [Entamoeba invadens IP1]ELP84985.1 hypothetical protein EIN_310870 [Entamoeba invadens IP1]|eukprot:XP_004184331.1 hypothetical protein EIN_310870 [Entamoeba invadens IP1]